MPSCLKLLTLSLIAAGLSAAGFPAQAGSYPVTEAQRQTATEVAQAGVPLSELAPDAPDSYVVKTHDTLWDISKLFLKSPWRWPELWGMNKEQIANPNLIYPGQTLVLIKSGGKAQLKVAEAPDAVSSGLPTVKLSPQVRSGPAEDSSIAAVPLNLIEPFLNEAVVFNTNELAAAPHVVATQEQHSLMTRGDLAYAVGDFSAATDWRLFRQATPLVDPRTHQILGYEARYLGTAEVIRTGHPAVKDRSDEVPTTLRVDNVREEVGAGDRLAPVPQHEFTRYIPHAPNSRVDGLVMSYYGDAMSAGQNQIVTLNLGSHDGIERGHVLALWKTGQRIVDKSGQHTQALRLPDERDGLLFVFQVYDRVSYALVVSTEQPVEVGDRVSEP